MRSAQSMPAMPLHWRLAGPMPGGLGPYSIGPLVRRGDPCSCGLCDASGVWVLVPSRATRGHASLRANARTADTMLKRRQLAAAPRPTAET